MTTNSNKTALITGASRGIGRATAQALADAGTRVIIHYGRSAKEADSLLNEIRATGGRADTVSADLSSPNGETRLPVHSPLA
jgi:3-oxoacyl-[acyl-carrier protein] reductase